MAHATRLAGYDVIAVLGYGASSTIYSVRSARGDIFALKLVERNSSDDQKFVDQAVNEFRVARAVDHPVLRKCYKLKRERNFFTVKRCLLVMEMVEARALVQRRPPQLIDLVRVFMEVASGLGAMHKAGWVHADMKPNNVLITEKGEVKVIDFGQSCPVGTRKERIQGTPDYIAPEQVKRRPLNGRTDIFNFGATMYWCVTDSHVPTLIPKNDNEIGLKADMEMRSPKDVNAALPDSLNYLIMHCLKYKPDERPDSMVEVRSRLEVVCRQLERGEATAATSPH
ncbi:MAG: serine/threonine protein kinase [Phycisphaerae bacterium]|nr:serine/threonine protein kinase [Phycisphaerae bacterium]